MKPCGKDKSLNWIDVVYSDQLLIEQYNYYGKLKKGFWDSDYLPE